MDLYEKVVMEIQADKVTHLVVNPGRVVVSNRRIYFQPYNKMGEVGFSSIVHSTSSKVPIECKQSMIHTVFIDKI